MLVIFIKLWLFMAPFVSVIAVGAGKWFKDSPVFTIICRHFNMISNARKRKRFVISSNLSKGYLTWHSRSFEIGCDAVWPLEHLIAVLCLCARGCSKVAQAWRNLKVSTFNSVGVLSPQLAVVCVLHHMLCHFVHIQFVTLGPFVHLVSKALGCFLHFWYYCLLALLLAVL